MLLLEGILVYDSDQRLDYIDYEPIIKTENSASNKMHNEINIFYLLSKFNLSLAISKFVFIFSWSLWALSQISPFPLEQSIPIPFSNSSMPFLYNFTAISLLPKSNKINHLKKKFNNIDIQSSNKRYVD